MHAYFNNLRCRTNRHVPCFHVSRFPVSPFHFFRSSLFVAALNLLLLSNASFAQRQIPVQRSSGIFLPSNRLDSRGIQRAKELIARGEYSQAVRFLDEVLARAEDSFVAMPVERPSASDYDRPKLGNNQRAPSNSEYERNSPKKVGGGFGGAEESGSDSDEILNHSGASLEDVGLKETARRILRDLPHDGRQIYESTFGPVARRLLQEAVNSGNFLQLRQIAQQYFYTRAGHEAALLFAHHEADQGRHLTAALTYQELLETPEAAARFQPQLSILAATSWLAANDPERANQLLASLGEHGYRNIQLSGQDYPMLTSKNGWVDWLLQSVGSPVIRDLAAERQWLTTRGNPARNGQPNGGLPHLRVRWQVRLLEHHSLEAVHDEMLGQLQIRQKQSRVPAATPLAVGDYVITRSAHGLIAIDFKTGKRIWQAQPQRVSLLQDLMHGSDPRAGNENRDNGNVESAQSFARTIWEDYLYNTTSSDGKRVFVIRDLPPPRIDRAQSLPFLQQSDVDEQGDKTNRLCAYDLPTQGKLVWEIDGAARTDELQGAFFLGAPVAVGQSLYCLAEISSETAIYLVVLDRSTGALRWRQQLADLEVGIARDIMRRLQASMPSYDEGMLICPTGAGVAVGVDLAKQSLAWAYRYRPEGLPLERQKMQRQKMLEGYTSAPGEQWVHCAPIIADGRVLLTPAESNQLHCLDLHTGKLLWKQPRGNALFVAGIDDGQVLLVGNRHMSALSLADGKPIWPSERLELPDGAMPTGSGFFSNGRYFLPLSNSQVVAVIVSTGNVVAKASSRDGQLLGNLICYRGAVISQTGRHLDCFEQVDVLRAESEQRRAANPTDFEALRTLGEIAYNEGQLDQAVELLSLAYDSEPEDLRTREVLGETLVAVIDKDFSKYQNLLPLLAQLQPGSAKARLTLMRLQASGLLQLGRASEAFEICLKAYELISAENSAARPEAELLIGRDHKVGARRWLAAQALAAWSTSSHDQREQIVEQFAPLYEQTLKVDDAQLWEQFYDCFGALEPTEALGFELAAIYRQRGELLAAQQLFLKLAESKNPNVRNNAVANNSRLLHEAELPLLAVSYDEELGGSLADQECLPGMTGAECLAEWASSNKSPPLRWPYGQVEASVQESNAAAGSRRNRNPQTGIYLERSDDVLGNCNLMREAGASGRNRAVTIRDSLGRDFFQAKLDEGARSIMRAQGGVYGVSRGNLLVLSLGREIVAYDTLSPNGQPLWRRDTTSNLQYLNQRQANSRRQRGWHLPGRSESNGNWLGLIGPVTHDSCVFQIAQRLVCVDSLTGEEKWSREGLPLGCDLFGDERHLFVLPKDSKQALTFSTVDGRSLGETAHFLPAWQERLATVGRQIIRWRTRTDRRQELSSIDSLHGEVLWAHEFERNARVDVAQNRFVAVADPTGRCAIVDINAGRLVVDRPIEPNTGLEQVHLLAGTTNFVVAVQHRSEVDRKRPVTAFNSIDFTNSFSGQVYSFDRRTGLAIWDRPANVQGLPLMLAQPVDLPIIAFAGNLRKQDRNGTKQELGIMLLEKSSGRMLFDDRTLPQSPHYFFVQASESVLNEVDVVMNTRKIALKFTGRPRAPEPPTRHDVKRSVGSGTGGLQKIGEKIFNQG